MLLFILCLLLLSLFVGEGLFIPCFVMQFCGHIAYCRCLASGHLFNLWYRKLTHNRKQKRFYTLSVLYNIATILLRMSKLVALLLLSSWCLETVSVSFFSRYCPRSKLITTTMFCVSSSRCLGLISVCDCGISWSYLLNF